MGRSRVELTDLNKITDAAVVGIRLPATRKNNIGLLGSVQPTSRVENMFVDVVVMQSGASIDFNVLVVKSFTDQDSGYYECELSRDRDHWIKKADKFRLRDIKDWGTFELTRDNILDNWTDDGTHTDGGDGFLFAPANYGRAFRNLRLSVEDIRPFFSPLWLLRKAFCDIGWTFESPYLESNYGRRIWDYLLKGSYGDQENLRKLRRFTSLIEPGPVADSLTGVYIDNAAVIKYVDEIYDADNNYDTVSGHFTGSGIYDFHANVEFETQPAVSGSIDQTNEWALLIIKEDTSTGNYEVLAESARIKTVGQETITLTVTAEDVLVTVTDVVYVALFYSNQVLPFQFFSGYFWNDVKRTFYDKFDIIQMRETIDEELTLLDYLRSVIFDFDGKVETDFSSRTVKVFPPLTTKIYDDEQIEGYFIQDQYQAQVDVICDSKTVVNRGVNGKRFFLLQFQNSSDPYVKSLGFSKDKPIFSKVVDRGEDYKQGIERFTNPLIEPTANKESSQVLTPVDFAPVVGQFILPTGLPFDAPVMWDNDDGKVSYDIAPRRLYCVGVVEQYSEDLAGEVKAAKLNFDSTLESFFPYLFQAPNAFIDANLSPIDYRFIYGDQEVDHYNFFWRFRSQARIDKLVSYKLLMTLHGYNGVDFRKLQSIDYGGEPFSGFVENLTLEPCEGTATIEMIPTIGISTCPPVGENDRCEGNEAGIRLITTQPGTQYCVSAIPDNDNFVTPPTSDTWEVSLDGGVTWSSYSPGAVICGQLNVLFRRTVEFEQCPDLIIVRPWGLRSTCLNSAQIDVQYDEATNTARAVGDRSNISSTIATEVWEVSIDGGDYQPYNEGNPVTGFNVVCFRWTITFADGCPDIELEKCIEIEDPICDNGRLILQLTEKGECTYYPEVLGTSTSEIWVTTIEVSYDGGDKFYPWDGTDIYSPPDQEIIVRALVHFCDGCKPICLETTC